MSTWTGVADAYRASFATLCEGTVERLLTDTFGRDHLDVGSGTGTLAARAASLGRRVVAVDADPEMVALSTDVVSGLVMEASLPDLPFGDDTFDAVTANFVINHVSNPRAAMHDLARVTRPGGRIGLTIWPAQTPAWAPLVVSAFDTARVVPIPGQRLHPDLDFERSASGLRGLAQSVGMKAITTAELTWDWTISINALWSGIAGGVATVGQTYVAQTPDVQKAAERAFRDAAREIALDGVLTLPSRAVYVLAT